MRLFIDTSDNKKTVVSLGERTTVHVSGVNRAQEVVKILDRILSSSLVRVNKISEVRVETGPGSFTGLKVGVAVANTIGFVLGVRVNDKDVLKDGPAEPKYG